MKRSRIKLHPATIGEARARLGLENRPNEWATKRRRARRERKAENRARFQRRQQLRKQLAKMKRGIWPRERFWIKALLEHMPRLPGLFDSPAPNHAAPTGGYWIGVDKGEAGTDTQAELVQVKLKMEQFTYPKLSLAEPLTEEQVAQLRQMVEEQQERLSRAMFLGIDLPWLRDVNTLKDGE